MLLVRTGFVYETDVESCELASGTLTFLRVSEMGARAAGEIEPAVDSSGVEKALNQSANTSL